MPNTSHLTVPRPRRAGDDQQPSAPSEQPSPSRQRGERRAPWRSLQHDGMRWWSAANLLSNAGTWMQLTAQNLLVLRLTHSAAATGLSLAVQAAPALLLGPVGGAAVDRWPRRVTVAASQSLLTAIALTTAALVALNLLSVPALMILAAVTGLIATVDGPACALLGNELVPREDVPSAIAVGSVVHSVGRVAGTALAGVTIGFFGIAGAYAANGVSFLCVVAVIPLLPAAIGDTDADVEAAAQAEAARRAGVAKTAGRGVEPAAARAATSQGGLRILLARRNLLILAGLSALSSILGRNYGLTLAALVTGPMHGSMKQYALISAVLAVGGTAGAVLAGRLRTPSVPVVAALTLAGALLQAVGALSPTVILLAVVVAPMAVAESLCDTATATILQTDPPAHLRGRVLGAWRSVSTCWQLAGPPLLGLLIQLAGARGALCAGGLLTAGAIGVTAAARRRRTANGSVPARPVRRLLSARAHRAAAAVCVAAHVPACTTEACLTGCVC
jgi:MFS family permease